MKYFKEIEFAKATPACKMSDCRESSLVRLDKARELAGVPFVLNSAYRSPSYEKSRGRSGKGAHTKGCAFDIACNDSRSRYRILCGALAAGFSRIGISKNFIHMDDCEELSLNVTWLY